MAFLDYSGLSHFLDKLKTIFVGKSQGSTNAGKALYVNNSGNVDLLSVDSIPTVNSTNLVTSGGVKNAIPVTMIGATAADAGTGGTVPAPAIADRDKFLKGDGTWMDIPGANVFTVSGTISNSSGSYSGTISDNRVTSDMKALKLELGTPEAFGDDITISCGNGSVGISCSDFSGSSTITISILEMTEASGNYIVYSESAAPSHPTAGLIWLKKV